MKKNKSNNSTGSAHNSTFSLKDSEKNAGDSQGSDLEDADVKAERERALLIDDHDIKHPLILKNVRKVYNSRFGQGKKVAVKDVSIGIEKNIVFGLLGMI